MLPLRNGLPGLLFGLAILAAGCAVPKPAPQIPERPAPDEPSKPEPDVVATPPAERDLLAQVRELVDEQQWGVAEALVRAEIGNRERARPSESELRLVLGEVLEKAGRSDEALVTYFTVGGAAGGGEVTSAQAWDGVARIRWKTGDDLGAARAKLRASDAAGRSARPERTRDLKRAIASLSDRDLVVLSRTTAWLPSHELVLEELVSRKLLPPDDRVLTVALLAPLSGRLENFGKAFVLGARLAVETRNAGRQTGGSRIEVRLVERDTEGDLLKASLAARDAILEDGAAAIVGPLLSVTSIGAGSVAQSFGVPLIAPTATDPQVAEIGPYVQTLAPSPRSLAEPLAEFSVLTLGKVRHGVLVARDGISPEFEREFRAAVERLGGEVAISLAFDPGESDFRRMLDRLRSENVDAVYIPAGTSDLESLAPQLEFYEFDRTILGNGGWTDPRVLDGGNQALQGAIFTVETAEDPGSEFSQRLRDSIRRRSGAEMSRFHVRGYQAMSALLSAVDQGGRRGEEIAELLARREFWPSRPEGEAIRTLTFRDGVLGPADWASGFDLDPRFAPPAERDEGDPDAGVE